MVNADAQQPAIAFSISGGPTSTYEEKAPDHSPSPSRTFDERTTSAGPKAEAAWATRVRSGEPTGNWPTSRRAPPDPLRARVSAPRFRAATETPAVTTTPGRTASPCWRPRASQAAFAPACCGSAQRGSSRSRTSSLLKWLDANRLRQVQVPGRLPVRSPDQVVAMISWHL